MAVMGLFILAGIISARKIISFGHYREVNQELLGQVVSQMDTMKQAARTVSDRSISADVSITSKRSGFEYLNELFIKRHRKILWKSAVRLAGICLVLSCAAAVALTLAPGARKEINMSLFFSIHYLTIYYLLQPYNEGTEMKSGMYQVILSVTYLVCFFLMQVRLPILVFGIACIAFCVVYSVVASVLVYRFAPKTFRLRT